MKLSVVVVALAICGCGGGTPAPMKSGAEIGTDAPMVMFGAVDAGTSAKQHLAVKSTGTNTLKIVSVSIKDDARGAFTNGGLPVQISAGSSAMLDLTYLAAPAATSDTATVVIASNAEDTPVLEVPLLGTTVAAPVPITVTLAGDGGGTVSSSPLGIDCGTTCTASFSPGTMVTLSAFANSSSAFTGFSGACTGMTCTIDVASAASVTATFVKTYTLSVAPTGNGSGTITGGGINCTVTGGTGTGACAVVVPEGTMITLAPTADPNSRFAAFTNDCSGSTCSLTVDSDKLVGARFAATFDVNVTLAGDGGGMVTSSPALISCSPTCTATLDVGSTLQLFGTADSSSHFSGFTGDCTGGSCSVSAAANVTATFVKLVTVNVTATGAGVGTITGPGISCTANAGVVTGTCSAQFVEGTSVTLTAFPGSNTTFNGWSNACSGATCTFTANNDSTANAQLLALYTVSVTMAGSGSGTVTSTPAGISCTSGVCTHQFAEGTNVTLTPSTSGSNSFTAFSGQCTGATCSFMPISANESVTATFASGATYSIGGTVTGLSSNLVLTNGTSTLPISSNGTFTFTGQPASYSVSVSTQPSSPAQTCTVTNGSGTATGTVTNIQVDCPPFSVASGLDHPNTLNRNGTTLYFARGLPPSVADCYSATGSGDAVMLVPADGSSAPTKIDDVDHSGGNCGVYGLVSDSTYVYWSNYSDGVIKKATLAGANVATVYVGPTYLNSLAIDATGGFLYYFAYSFGQIARVSTAGANQSSFASISQLNGINTTTDSTYLYWTDYSSGTVNKLAFATSPLPGTPTQIVTGEVNPAAPFVTASTIYWLTYGANVSVRYSSLASPSAQTLQGGLPSASGVVVDASYAYVLTNTTILKIPVGGGTAVTIAKNVYQPNSLVMDATHLYWAQDSTSGNSDGSIKMIKK